MGFGGKNGIVGPRVFETRKRGRWEGKGKGIERKGAKM